MEAIRKPPLSLNVVINQKDLNPRDPNMVYYPLLYLRGRAAFSLDENDLAALRSHFDPGGGTLFADSHAGSPAFDASFRRFVKSLFPSRPLVPIPHEDELFTTKVGADLSNVEYNKAAGGGRGFPQLEGVRIGGHWAIIYSKYDIGGVIDAQANVEGKGYTPESGKDRLQYRHLLDASRRRRRARKKGPEAGQNESADTRGTRLRTIHPGQRLDRPAPAHPRHQVDRVNVLYSIGSDHDPAGHSGLTHMLEHLYITAAAGPEKGRTAEEFARRYEMVPRADRPPLHSLLRSLSDKRARR